MTIVSIRDNTPVANPSEPDQLVIEEIERLLELARAGEIIGIAWGALHYDGIGTNHFEGRVSRNTVGQLVSVTTRISLRIDNEP